MHKENIPEKLHPLIPLVEKWGINDDGYRDEALSNASNDDLIKIVRSLEGLSEDLDNWLISDADKQPSTNEYVSFTCYLMAYDHAYMALKYPK